MRLLPPALSLVALLGACRQDAKDTGAVDVVVDVDGDGVVAADDCDDENGDVGAETAWYADSDGDGYGDADAGQLACEQPEGYVATPGDCDDAESTVHPGAEDVCDGFDNDCDGVVDNGATSSTWYQDADGDGYGDDGVTTTSCELPGGYAPVGGDCNDADPAYNPGADESDCADPNDYNCDGSVGYADRDGDGQAACNECDDGDAAVLRWCDRCAHALC